MARVHKNWVDAFVECVAPRSEAPISYLKLIALFTLSTAIKKRVKVPKFIINPDGKKEALLGGWECYPNLYVVLVADPGVARKSSTMNFGERLLDKLPNAVSSPTFISQASLMQTMSESPDGSIYIAVDELASLIMKSKTDMIEFLNDGYDTRKAIRGRTISRDKETIENPCITLFACTQPVWMKDNLPVSVITGGFASRTLFAYEEEPRQRALFYQNIDYDQIEKLEESLLDDLIYISTEIQGDFIIDQDAREFMESWYQIDNKKELEKSDYRLRGYFARKQVHLMKLAMLYSLATKDELVLTVNDFKQAFEMLAHIEKKISKIFTSIGKNEYTADIGSIREFLRQNKRVPQGLLFRTFEASAEPDRLRSLLQFFIQSREVDIEVAEDDTYYIYKDKTIVAASPSIQTS